MSKCNVNAISFRHLDILFSQGACNIILKLHNEFMLSNLAVIKASILNAKENEIGRSIITFTDLKKHERVFARARLIFIA